MSQLRSGGASARVKAKSLKERKNEAACKNASPKVEKPDSPQMHSSDDSASSGSEIEMQAFIIQSVDITTNEEMRKAVRDLASEEFNEITSDDVVVEEPVISEPDIAISKDEEETFSDASDLEFPSDTPEIRISQEIPTASSGLPRFTFTTGREVTLVCLWTLLLALGTVAKVKMQGMDVGPPPT